MSAVVGILAGLAYLIGGINCHREAHSRPEARMAYVLDLGGAICFGLALALLYEAVR